ncbi:unnamed protein product [Urochloa decumbens]|uniref:Wall-associated receptor kinase galacturonan-binding domain-containing protein n=1 Tax=Urochloa decumbens TaxID=240449 RepID=A0ABC9H1Z4_9POAL
MAPALFLFSWSVWVALPSVLLMPAAAADGQGGEPCLPVLCGNVTISFPFGLVPEDAAVQNSCGGVIGFQVRCRDSTPYLGYYQTQFDMQILSIFYDNASLLIAETGNGSPRGCRIPTANTSSEFRPPFSISPVNQNLIFYNCTKPLSPGGGLVETICRNNTYVSVAAERSDDGHGSYFFLEGCNATVVPVLGRSGETIASNYKELIRDGFLVTWQSPPSE